MIKYKPSMIEVLNVADILCPWTKEVLADVRDMKTGKKIRREKIK